MSLFDRLYRYRPSENRSPTEDFLTEALAGVLESSRLLRVGYASFLMQHHGTLRDVRVAAQRGSEGDRPDLILNVDDGSGRHHVIVLEHKVDAPEGDQQLQRYANWLLKQTHASSRTLVYVTRQRSAKSMNVSGIEFRTLRWFDAYCWLDNWVRNNLGASGAELANEMLSLLDQWRLTMTLSANDLAAAVLYQNSIEKTLYRVLNDVWNLSSVKGTQENRWSYSNPKGISYTSPLIHGSFRYQYGFDFTRADDEWNVARLGLPSAFFAVWAESVEADWEYPAEWTRPPSAWGWEEWNDLCRVTEIRSLDVSGSSLDSGYFEFFRVSLKEAELAVGLDGNR